MAAAKSTALSRGGPANDPGSRRPGRSEQVEKRAPNPDIDRTGPGVLERRGNDPAGAPSVGAVFRRRREEYGLAVDDIEADLCIRKGYLEAIETGDYDILPGTTYALGFVRAYADHIGLDAEQMVRRFKVEALGEPASTQARATAGALARKRKFPVAFVAAAIAIAVAAGLGGWTLSTMDRGGDVAAVPAPAPEVAPAEPPPTPIVQAAAVDSGPAGPAAAGDFGSAAIPAFAVAAPIGEASTAAPVDADQGADFRLTPRPKGRPIPDGAMIAAPPPSAAPAAAPATAPTQPAAAAPVQQAAAASTAETASPAQQAAKPPAAAEKAKEPEKKAEKKSIMPERPTVVYGTPGRARVSFTAVDMTRIRIHSTGGEVLFDGVMLPGDVYRVPDRPGLMLMTESAGGLKFTVDGGNVPAIGPKGALRHNVFLNPMLLREGRAAPH